MTDIFGALFTGSVIALVMLFNGLVGHWVASRWLSDRESKVAGFAFSLGGGFSGAFARDFGDKWAILSGAIVGLALLWRAFFKREIEHG